MRITIPRLIQIGDDFLHVVAPETEIAFRCPQSKGLVDVVAGAAFDFPIKELERIERGGVAEASGFSGKGPKIINGDGVAVAEIDPRGGSPIFSIFYGLILCNCAVVTAKAYLRLGNVVS